MPRKKTISESVDEIKQKYSKRTLGFVEFYDGDKDGKIYAYHLHRVLMNEEGYVASLSKLQLDANDPESSKLYGVVEIGDLDSGINGFYAFHVRIYPNGAES